MSIRSPQCSMCLDAPPYEECPGRGICALIVRLERDRNRAREALTALLDFLEEHDLEAGMVWKKRDRREFEKMGGLP